MLHTITELESFYKKARKNREIHSQVGKKKKKNLKALKRSVIWQLCPLIK